MTSSLCTNKSFFFWGEELPKGDKVFWKQNILLQIHFLFGKNICLKGDKFFNFFLRRILAHLCLLATVLKVPGNNVAS
jgi:hypothetical protein